MTFKLDTSGFVMTEMVNSKAGHTGSFIWTDLSPFTQGYIEALFADADRSLGEAAAHDFGKMIGFADLAPETLARIIADCEAIQAAFPVSPNYEGGWQAWCVRRDGGFDMGGKWPGLPPGTVQLCDDGKVRFQDTPND